MKRSVRLFVVLLLAAGCSEEFNPVVEGDRPFVVFALLNGSSSVQVVRVHGTAAPLERDPGYPGVSGTVVRVSGAEGTYTFRDTILIPPPGSADTAGVPAFIMDGFVPLQNQAYALSVTTPRGNASATLFTPGKGQLTTTDFFVVQGPYNYAAEKSISLRAILSPYALGYVIRFVVEYERLIGAVWTKETVEVPWAYQKVLNDTTFEADYPFLLRRASASVTSPQGFLQGDGAAFQNSSYLVTLRLLYNRYGRANLRMRRGLFVLTQADPHFFTYYSLSNNFQDKFTIRVDQPDYSNVTGALGFFGSTINDTLIINLPPNLSPPDL